MNWNAFWLGVLGGFLSELVRGKKALDDGKTLNASAWIGLGIALVLGGIAGLLSTSTEKLVLIGAGYSAPAFFSGLLGKREETTQSLDGQAPPSTALQSVRDWWSY